MSNSPFQGVFAPLVTVFDRDEQVLPDAIVRNVEAYNTTALRGYMPLGSNGEFQGLRDRESLEILDAVVSHKAPNKIIVGGCGRESVRKTVDFIRQAASYGLDYAFILPPHYFARQISDEGLAGYYLAVADASPIPLVVYNAPKFSAGINLTPQFVAQLAGHPNIIALKNSSNTPNRDYMEALTEADFVLIAGNIGTFYSGLCEGAVGGVLSTASYLPEYCVLLFQLFSEGRLTEAGQLSQQLQAISQATAGPLGVAGVKAAMDLRGLNGGRVRLPLTDVPPERVSTMAQAFTDFSIPSFPANPDELSSIVLK